MLELAKIETCESTDLLETVYESISVHKELSRRFGNVEVVLKEALDRHKGFTVERIYAAVLEYFLKEHLAKSCGKLVDKSADTEIFVADNVLFCLKHFAYLKSHLSLFVCSCKVLDVVNYRRDTNGDPPMRS